MNRNQLSTSTDHSARFAAHIVAAYLRNHIVPRTNLTNLIAEVKSSFDQIEIAAIAWHFPEPVVEKQKPAVSIRKSIRDDSITCLECGGHFKSMKRHLTTFHSLSPDSYRAKWRLPAEYPMVAPAYAEARSLLAREMGLGRGRQATRGSKRP